jgi:hypothetical protein
MFLDETDRQTESEVARIVEETLFPNTSDSNISSTIRRIVANYHDNIPIPNFNIDIFIRYLGKSIRVKRLNLVKKEDIGTGAGQSHPAWNIYIHPPTKTVPILREWRAVIRDTVFTTDSNDAGKTHKIFNCSTCRSIDHPGGMCPYPTLNGWVPPVSANSPALDNLINANQNRQDNRNGNRGRGTAPNHRGRPRNNANNRGTQRA